MKQIGIFIMLSLTVSPLFADDRLSADPICVKAMSTADMAAKNLAEANKQSKSAQTILMVKDARSKAITGVIASCGTRGNIQPPNRLLSKPVADKYKDMAKALLHGDEWILLPEKNDFLLSGR